MPTFFEMYSFIFASSGCIIGPLFEYKDYDNFINIKERYMKIPNTLVPTLKTIGSGVICLIIYLISNRYISITYIDSIEFKEQSRLMKIVYLYWITETRLI